ncbi:hypothetical protein V1511DRAFT_506828 [Dipodascopsis uninucleata]
MFRSSLSSMLYRPIIVKRYFLTSFSQSRNTSSLSRHSNLTSFLEYAEQTKLDSKSTYYIGTLYEYTVLDALGRLGIDLKRQGGTGDKGIDLRGCISIANRPAVPVVVQCKAEKKKPSPRYVRELEGSLSSYDYNSEVLAILAAKLPATDLTLRALSISERPMAFCLVAALNEGALVKQFVWNKSASSIMRGLRVVPFLSHRFTANDADEPFIREIRLVEIQ